MATLTTKHFLTPTKAPLLPLAPVEYDQRYGTDLTNALRLYFNQLDNLNNNTISSRGGRFLNFPYAAVQRTTNRNYTSANTALQVTFNQNDYINGCTNDGTDGIHAEYAGIYNYQFSVQFANPDTQVHTCYIWLKINGTNVAGTASKFDVPAKHGSSDGYLIAAANFYVQLQANDYVEMWTAADSTQPYMEAYAAQASPWSMPAIPSVVATLSFVSSLPT